MFERFTERSRHVVVVAQEQARTLEHRSINSCHLLLGLLADEEAVAARCLASVDVTEEAVLAKVTEKYPPDSEPPEQTQQLPFTPEARSVLERGLREALSLGHNYIGTEHLLLALVREYEGMRALGGMLLIEDLGVSEQAVRDAVVAALTGPVPRRRRRDTKVQLEVSLEEAERLLTALRTGSAVPRASWELQDKLVVAIHEAEKEATS